MLCLHLISLEGDGEHKIALLHYSHNLLLCAVAVNLHDELHQSIRATKPIALLCIESKNIFAGSVWKNEACFLKLGAWLFSLLLFLLRAGSHKFAYVSFE